MEDIKVQVGQLIRDTRKAKGLTQKEIGKKMGITEASFNRYENGVANLSLETVQKIAEALNLKARLIFE
ncbi:helix-turn-helix transcriptional regulator [Spirosoma sp. KCTC 42546]|uniref:helix-turn-helix domain-containing protein n=1 Tax=Spirosoma sp. KCTC 42546 TaxID=2520506 RepID=UPI00115A4612|nr:helix-turn-helix transcriptional regulator [Spirosoma sp. KCTC 42546]QDK79558.1 helix-turn-helix transcriptional regulator [Spirosoma sp. KCTC 42546]